MSVLIGSSARGVVTDFTTTAWIIAFKLTASASGDLRYIYLRSKVPNADLTGSMECAVYADSAGNPGARLTTVMSPSAGLVNGAAPVRWNLATPLTLVSGTVYHIALRPTAGALDWQGDAVANGYQEKSSATLTDPWGTAGAAGGNQPELWGTDTLDPMITTVGLTGFEHGFIGTGANAGGGLFDAAPGSGWSASTTAPRNGAYSARLVAPASTATKLSNNFVSAPTKIVVRFGVKVVTRPAGAGNTATLAHFDNGTVNFGITDAGVTRTVVGGTARTGDTIDTGNWHLIELQLDSVAKTLDWKIDGVAQTRNTGGTVAAPTSFSLGTWSASDPTFTAEYDDVIVGTWVDPATDWYGDGKVLAQLPGVDGTHATITSLSPGDAGTAYAGTPTTVYTMVDDAPGTGGWTATRSTTDNIALRTATVGAYAETKPAPTAETGSANAVRAIIAYSSSGTQANLAACDVRNSAGAVAELWGLTGGVGKDYSEATNFFKSAIATRPAVGWTAAEVNAIRIRFGGCTSADISPIPTIQAWMIEVDWPAAAGPTAYPRTASDSWAVSDVATRAAAAWLRPVTDSWAVSDAATGTLGGGTVNLDRTATDTVVFSDVAIRAPATRTRGVTDTVLWSDAAVRAAAARVRSVNDTVAWSDVAVRASATRIRPVSDTIAWSDTALRAPMSRVGLASDSVAWSDTALRAAATRIRPVVDSWAVSDSVAGIKIGGVLATATDTIVINDSAVRAAAAKLRTATDLVLWSDVAVRAPAARVRPVSDSVAWSDTANRAIAALVRGVIDTWAVSDTAAGVKVGGVLRTAVDTVVFSDTAAGVKIGGAIVTAVDTVVISDVAARAPATRARVAVDSWAVSSSALRATQLARTATDSWTVVSTAVGVTGVRERTATDLWTVSSTAGRVFAAAGVVSDIWLVTDVTSSWVMVARATTDSFSVSDYATAGANVVVTQMTMIL